MSDSTLEIRHDAAGRRFVTKVDGSVGYAEYTPEGDALAITHTAVPEAIGGRGIAGKLMAAVLSYARSEGKQVIPRCSYAAAYIKRHPEEADLVG